MRARELLQRRQRLSTDVHDIGHQRAARIQLLAGSHRDGGDQQQARAGIHLDLRRNRQRGCACLPTAVLDHLPCGQWW